MSKTKNVSVQVISYVEGQHEIVSNSGRTEFCNQTNQTITVEGIAVSMGESRVFDFLMIPNANDVTRYNVVVPTGATGNLFVIKTFVQWV